MGFADSFNSSYNAASNRKSSREALALQKKELDANLMMKGYNPETLEVIPGSTADVERAQNQQALQLASSLQGKLAAQETDNAILDYSETGDATFLQGALDKNPYLKQAWAARGVQNVANLDWTNDSPLLSKAGFSPAEYDTPEKQDILKKNIYKYYDGTNWNVGLLNNVVKESGVLNRVGGNRGQAITNNFQGFRDFLAGPRSSANTAEGHKYENEIMAASQETGVPANLLAAMLNQESNGNPQATSSKGAEGLMQLMPGTAKELGVTDTRNPMQNIMGGAKYMAQQLEKYGGDTRLALAAYNAGPGAVDRYGGVPPFAETTDYVNRIYDNYANGESYYNTGAPSVEDVMRTDANGNPVGNTSPDFGGMAGRQNANMDKRISTIQNFVRGNANAVKGTTNENEDLSIQTEALKAKAAAQANIVKAATEGTTANQKDLKAAEGYTNKMLEEFGGEEEFFKTDFSDPANFNKAWKNVVKINKLEGTELTQDDKKNVTDIRSLIALSDPASQLTSSQTGIIDNSLSGLSKYLSDNSSGVERTAAMASFRNTLRNALYGSTLTDGEIAAFNEAFGNNKQKLGPVLHQFKVALGQIQSKLDSAANLTNPYTAKVMIGADQERLSKIRQALQQRIDYIEGKSSEPGSGQQAQLPGRPAAGSQQNNRPSLDTIFSKGSN